VMLFKQLVRILVLTETYTVVSTLATEYCWLYRRTILDDRTRLGSP